MVKTIRLTGGTDIFDARGFPAFAGKAEETVKTASGREVPKYVFHSLDGSGGAHDSELRGMAVEVPDDVFAALQATGLPFEEVTKERADFDRWRMTLRRTALDVLVDPATGQPVPAEKLVPPGTPKAKATTTTTATSAAGV